MLKRIIIIASLSFNCAVLVGLAWGARGTRALASSDNLIGPLFRKLNLTSAQREQLNQSNHEVLDRIIQARNEMRRKWAEGVELLSEPDINWAAVQAKQAEISKAQEVYQGVFFQVWMDRAQMLNPVQRLELFPTVKAQIENGTFFNWRAPERSPKEAAK